MFGILLILAGLWLTFAGLRAYLLMLPVVGFVVGFFLGASATASWLGESLPAGLAGWVAGLALGVLFAAPSYAYWYVGVILATSAVGSMIGMALYVVLVNTAIGGATLFIAGALLLGEVDTGQMRWGAARSTAHGYGGSRWPSSRPSASPASGRASPGTACRPPDRPAPIQTTGLVSRRAITAPASTRNIAGHTEGGVV